MSISDVTNAPVSIHWPRTVAAWCTTIALAFIVVVVVGIYRDDWDLSIVHLVFPFGPILLVASLITVVTHYSLHRIGCIRLSHYGLGYLTVILPMMLNTFFESGYVPHLSPFEMLRVSLVLSPALFVCWFLYFRVFGHQDELNQNEVVGKTVFKGGSTVTFVEDFVPIFLTALMVFVLCTIFREVLGLFVRFGESHPVAVWHGGLTPLVVLVWGTLAHFILVQLRRNNLSDYTLAFGVFSAAFASLDLGMFALMQVILFLSGSDSNAGASFSDVVASQLEALVGIGLFPALVLAAGPILWWLRNRMLTRYPPSPPT